MMLTAVACTPAATTDSTRPGGYGVVAGVGGAPGEGEPMGAEAQPPTCGDVPTELGDCPHDAGNGVAACSVATGTLPGVKRGDSNG